MTLSTLTIPTTPAARAALEVVTEYATPALRNHSIRAYLWAAEYASDHGIAFDAELLYVAAMLHDLTLVAAFDNYSLPFEEAGAHLAWAFGAGAGWPVERRRRTGEIIIRHMADAVDVHADPEGHLLELSTAMDISGRQTDEIAPGFRAEVLAAYPRLELPREFTAYFVDQASRKPGCLAAQFVRNGFAARVAANPLDESPAS